MEKSYATVRHAEGPRAAVQRAASPSPAASAPPFDPANAECWIAHGRPPEIAHAIAQAWTQFPDLPAFTPLEDRQARTRDRVAAMRPALDGLARHSRRERESSNFAFVERALASGSDDVRHGLILSGRSRHGFGWDEAVQYANGFHAASVGWDHRPPSGPDHSLPALRHAYDRGFRDRGGCPEDLFDAARRALLAGSASGDSARTASARPLPSRWPAPSDQPRSTGWARRLLILAAGHADQGAFIAASRVRPGSEDMTIILASPDQGYRLIDAPGPLLDDPIAQLRALIAGKEFEDILVAAHSAGLDMLDRHASALPLCRTMERTRNSALQQRQKVQLWLDRGRCLGDTRASGHIRWGKAIAGLTGRLGEFTACYAGPARPKGHRIVIEREGGAPATGLADALGARLDPERIISNKSHLRKEMAAMLRTFAAAIPAWPHAGLSSSPNES